MAKKTYPKGYGSINPSLIALLTTNYLSMPVSNTKVFVPKKTRKKRQRKRDNHKLIEFTAKELKDMPSTLKPDRYKKKWVRLDLGHAQKQRVWKTATFLTNDLFATRLNQKKGALLYHICFETKSHIMYSLTPLGEEHCAECESQLPTGAQMLVTLQKLTT